MTAVMAASTALQVLDDPSQPTSQTPSPTSPTPSLQNVYRSTGNPNGIASSAYASSSLYQNVTLDLPPGMSYPDFLRTWTDAHVARWLTDIKCGHHAATFKANDIRGDVLLELDQVTLKEMGMTSVGDRLRIVNAVKFLRQRCSSTSSPLSVFVNRPRFSVPEHSRSPSGDLHNSAARGVNRRLEGSRPAPLHLTPAGSLDLPRVVRDGQDSAKYIPSIRPLPQPSSGSSHGTPTTAHSTRSNLPPLPPPPRGQPPLPPTNGRLTPRSLQAPANPLSGRRTPESSPLSSHPAPHGQNLLSPASQSSGSSRLGFNLSPDTRQGNRTPIRTTSPLPLPPISSNSRNLVRPPNESGSHNRNTSLSNPASNPPGKSPSRPPQGNSPHPYASSNPQHGLSPIAESFATQRSGSNAPSYKAGISPLLRPGTPSYNTPSLDDLKRKLAKFILPDEGQSTRINTADCTDGVEVLMRALKKLGKLSSRLSPDSVEHVELEHGALCVDGWGAYLDYGQDGTTNGPLTAAQLLSICQAPADDPARDYGLTLRMIERLPRRGESPTSLVFANPDFDPDEELMAPDIPGAHTPSTKNMKRASSVSILSGLGVRIPEKASDTSASNSPSQSPVKSASGGKKVPSKLRNFFGQRPPSELITTHLAEYFPFTEKKVLERTRRQSMMRTSGARAPDRRDSIISWNPPPSRFSVSTLGSQQNASPRVSVSSASVPLPDKPPPPVPTVERLGPPLRLSLSTDEGHSLEITETDQSEASKRVSSPHILPPVAFPSESLSESLNLGPSLQGTVTFPRTLSNASKRMSYITELRSKRDRSDAASLLTVDEITAEVESREISESKKDVESTEEWTKVDVEDEYDKQSIKEEEEEDHDVAGEEEESELDEDDADDVTVEVDDEGEPGKAITSRERTIKWIKGALIGAGSFGKVYLGMDAATGLLMAVKQVELPTGSAPNEERKKSMLSALEHEIELLKEFHHENIVQYHSSCIDDDHLNIFLEYVPGGSVTSLLRNYGAFEEPLVRNWVRQILLGLNYLHERDIIHRDIKGANMLVDNKGGVKISDFGISKKVEDNLLPGHRAHRPSLQGSVFWMAPEVVKQTAYTQKADIWSVGCLVVEMLTGEHPWAQLTQMQAIFKIGSSAKPTIPADISAEAENFLQLTFELNHKARPTAAELLKHPWIVNQPLPLGH
ncbi:hypothetical protein BKA93DRAFT_220477 [Sparassis latifolia]